MDRILIAGAGYTGQRIANYFRSKNQKVWGIIRTTDRKSELQKIGAVPMIADLTRPETLSGIPPADFVVISVAPNARDEASYREVYLEGVGNLLKRIKETSAPSLVVYLSSTGVHPDLNGEWIDETTEPKPDTERGKILLEAESQVLNSGLPSVVFRLAGIYGPERNRIQFVREGKWKAEKNDRYLNMIHVDDIVGAIPVLFKSAEAGKVYLGVDDKPVLESEFIHWIAGELNVPVSKNSSNSLIGGKRCRNTRLKSLGFTFRYPTFRDGYTAFLK